ncbi:carbohydrate ABC transporter permease [Streptomyces boninensis]|uniref:carbohydrate ABC transporter permease n=1 Tax=Streptomyces boninensis TaxID=2039455 RepID=UPI003B22462E
MKTQAQQARPTAEASATSWWRLPLTVKLLFIVACFVPPRFTPARVRADRRYRKLDQYRFAYAFLAVPLLFYVVFVISPFLQAFFYSMTDWTGFTSSFSFLGFDNFTKLFEDEKFTDSLKASIILLVVAPVLTLSLGLFFAYMLTSGGRHRRGQAISGIFGAKFYKIVFFFPQVLSVAIIAVVWQQVLAGDGLLNGVLGAIGAGEPGWLGGDYNWALAAVLIVLCWSFTGFYIVLFSAAMGAIPKDIYEAALLDGAGRSRTFFSITFPLTWDTIRTGWIYMGIQALDSFAIVLVMVPRHALKVAPVYLYEKAFRDGQAGYATAIGVVLFVISMLFALIMMRIGRRERIEY